MYLFSVGGANTWLCVCCCRVLSVFPCLLPITGATATCSFVLSEKIPDFLIYKSWAGTDRNMTNELPGNAPLASSSAPMRMNAGLRRYLDCGVDFLVPFSFVGRENTFHSFGRFGKSNLIAICCSRGAEGFSALDATLAPSSLSASH